MQKYGKISKLPRLSTKKIGGKFLNIRFCNVDHTSFILITHFSHSPSGTRFCPFLSPLMAFEGVSCYHRALRPLKYSTIGSCSPPILRFPQSFLKKRRTFSKKRWTFSKKRRSFLPHHGERKLTGRKQWIGKLYI